MLDFNDAAPALKLVTPEEYEQQLERLRTILQNQAGELVRDVFPRARIQGVEARVGSTDGEPGESLSITLAGDRAGLWFDHATGEGGDLIDLWCAVQGYGQADFPKAVADLERWAGLSTAPRFTSAVAKVAEKRKAEADKAPRAEVSLGPPVASWHYLSPDGVVLAIVRRYDLDETDPVTGKRKKTFRPFKADGAAGMPNPRPLYRLPEIRSAETVVFVEGEKCAEALASVGVEATCIMGGSNTLLEKSDLSPLAGKKILLWPDNDGEGKNEATSHVGLKFMARLKAALEEIGCEVVDIPIPTGKPPKWDAADAVADGDDIGAILAAAHAPPAAANPRALRFLSIEDLQSLRPPEWLVDGLAPYGAFVSIYGQHGSLKSFLALDWALCTAYGRPWLGKYAVKGGPVVYVAGEGQAGLAARIIGWKQSKSESGRAPLHIVPQAVAVTVEAQIVELIALIATLPVPPVLIVLDTLARTFGPGDENSQKDMNAYIAAVDRLRAVTGATVLVVHHTGKDDSKGARGSTALPGAVDTNIMVKRDGRTITLKNKAPHGKQKDAEEFEDIRLTFRTIEFQHQDQAATTLILTLDESPVADEEGATEVRRARPQGANQQAIMTAIHTGKGEPLGLTRLSTMIGKDTSDTLKACSALVEKGLLVEVGEEGARRWKFS